MNKSWLFLVLMVLISCGLPEYDYIEAPQNPSGSENGILGVSIVDSPSLSSFVIYSRYFTGNEQSSNFTITSLEDTPQGSVNYLENIDYTQVSFVRGIDLESDVTASPDIPVSSNASIQITYDPSDNKVVLSVNNTLYLLKSNYKNSAGEIFTHFIGSYSDDEGSSFLIEFAKTQEDVTIRPTNIEFSIFNRGLSVLTLSPSESFPVYIGTISLQIQE